MPPSLKERLPEVLPRFRDSRLATVIEAIQAEFDTFRSDTEEVSDSLFVNSADGDSLDQIGADFGVIGRRRGRPDAAYRQFLRSLVPAFDGRGTEQDVEIAVAAGVARDPTVVDLRQDFGNREYQIELFDWSAHRTGTIRELADIADPVAVDRIDPVFLFSDVGSVIVDGASTEPELKSVGLSSDRLDELSISRNLVSGDVPLQVTGQLADVDTTDVDTVGLQFDASVSVGLELIAGGEETSFVIDSFQTNRLDIARRVPDATRVALRLTSTGQGSASVILGSAVKDPVADPQRLSTAII